MNCTEFSVAELEVLFGHVAGLYLAKKAEAVSMRTDIENIESYSGPVAGHYCRLLEEREAEVRDLFTLLDKLRQQKEEAQAKEALA